MRYLCTLVVFLTCLIAPHTHAEIKIDYVDTNAKIAVVKIINKIEYEEDELFIAALEKLAEENYKIKLNSIVLNSAGGNVTAAINIGETIRAKKLNTYVSPSAICTSSCVYVFIGGVVRMAYGLIGVHRSTFNETIASNKIHKAISNSDNKIESHVKSMGVSMLLLDAIQMTPNWLRRELSPLEKSRWGVHGVDRIYEELWLRSATSDLGYSYSDIEMKYHKHIIKCFRKATNFEVDPLDCVLKSKN